MIRPLDTRTHYVYRCYDADDRLIYIGCTVQPVDKRLIRHRSDVRNATVRWAADEYPDRVSALTAEARAIYFEKPSLNVRHNAARNPRAGQVVPLTTEEDAAELRQAVHALSTA